MKYLGGEVYTVAERFKCSFNGAVKLNHFNVFVCAHTRHETLNWTYTQWACRELLRDLFKYKFIISDFLSFILSQNRQIRHKNDFVLRRKVKLTTAATLLSSAFFFCAADEGTHQYNLWHNLNNEEKIKSY